MTQLDNLKEQLRLFLGQYGADILSNLQYDNDTKGEEQFHALVALTRKSGKVDRERRGA
jgi:hypothetical protein